MTSGCFMFESARNSKIKILEMSPAGLLFDGITDFLQFTKQIQNMFGPYTEIIQLSPTLSFISINKTFRDFSREFTDFFLLSRYEILSIFLKQSLFDQFIDKCNDLNEIADFNDSMTQKGFDDNLFYLCFEKSDFNSNYLEIQNLQDAKFTSSFPQIYFYGFKTFTDLIDAYIVLIQNRQNWPVFGLSQLFIKRLQNKLEKLYNYKETSIDLIKKNNHKLERKFRSTYPYFNPNKLLFYVSFIETAVPNPEKIINADQFYFIKKVNDVQVSHIYQVNQTDSTIRTFLGFDDEFRCLHVYDYFQKLSKKHNPKIIDVILVPETKTINFKVHYDLYYIKIFPNNQNNHKLGFIPSLIYSINPVDFNVASSSYYSFANCDDFEAAKQFLLSYDDLNKQTLIKDVKAIIQDDYFDHFEERIARNMERSKFSFLTFRIKKGDLTQLKPLFKGSKIIEKEVVYDNQKVVLVGFKEASDRDKAHKLLIDSNYIKKYRCYRPENPQNQQQQEEEPETPKIVKKEEVADKKAEVEPIKSTEKVEQIKNTEKVAQIKSTEKVTQNKSNEKVDKSKTAKNESNQKVETKKNEQNKLIE